MITLRKSFLHMDNIIYYIFSALSLLIAITIHEFSHALAADKLGDPTPRSEGRLTLNPLKHLDPLGTLMLLVARFGWGKPVPVDSYNFKNPRRDELIVAFSGPLSNLLLAVLVSLLLSFTSFNFLILSFLFTLVQLNLVLAIFNLIPIPPLDGSKILFNLLPVDTSAQWQEALEKYGSILLIAAVFLPIYKNSTLVDLVISPTLSFLSKLLLPF